MQNSARSRDELATIAGVSHDTIHKVENIQEKAKSTPDYQRNDKEIKDAQHRRTASGF